MKKISVILIGILLLLTVAYMLVGNYFFNYALNAKQEKEFLQGNPHLEKTVNVSGNVLVTNEQKNAEFISKYKPNTIVMRSF